MNKKEFEILAGYEVTTEDYAKIIEPMYMATDLTKQDFVKCIDKSRFALATEPQLIRKMRRVAKHLYDICGHRRDIEAEDDLDKLQREYSNRFCGGGFALIEKGYEYPGYRGCPYPENLVIYSPSLCIVKKIPLVQH